MGANYDSDGQLLYDLHNSYAWDTYHHVATINAGTSLGSCGSSGVTCITYDAFERPVEKNVGGAITQFLYSPIGLTAFMNGQTSISIRLPVPGGTILTNSSQNGNLISHVDWLGSARLEYNLGHSCILDAAYTPYGEKYNQISCGAGALTFTSDFQDLYAGLYDTPNREFDVQAGSRWLSPDPADSGWNGYAYPTNPNSETDSTGLCTGDDPYCMAHPDVYAYQKTDYDTGQVTYCDCGRSSSPGITIQSDPNRDPGNSWGNMGNPAVYTMVKMANLDWGMSAFDHAPSWLREGANQVNRGSSVAPAQASGAAQNAAVQVVEDTLIGGAKGLGNMVIDTANTVNGPIDTLLSKFTGFQFGQMSEYQGSTPGEKSAMAGIFLASFLVGAGEEQSAVKLSSSIGNDAKLTKFAEEAGQSVQKGLDHLVAELAKGNTNPGIGTKSLGGGISYARARDGARLFFRQSGNRIDIVAKASKANEAQVINYLKRLY